MPYAKQTWVDGPAGATPITAARLNVMEEGIASAGAWVHTQESASASWAIAHPLGRQPGVGTYIGGELVEGDVVASATHVYITWPSPLAGTAVLT